MKGWLLLPVDGGARRGFVIWHGYSGRTEPDFHFPFADAALLFPCVIAHGCSLGAFHAANIAFRHPHLFKKLAAFSGRYDLTLNVDSFRDLFDGYYSEDIYFHTPVHFLPGLNCDERLRHLREMEIVFTVGQEDPFRGNNEQFSDILRGKGIGHEMHLWHDRAHQGHYWRRMAHLYI